MEDEFLEVVKEASVLDRGRNGEEEAGDVGAVEKAGCEGDNMEPSEPADCDLEVIGTIKF